MTLVDTTATPQAPIDCLCGRPHPCPQHGAWATNPDPSSQLDLFIDLRDQK